MAYIWRGDLMEGFFVMSSGAFIWSLFSEFYTILFLRLMEHSLTLQIQLFFLFVSQYLLL